MLPEAIRLLTDKCYQDGYVSSRKNVTGKKAVRKYNICDLWPSDSLEEHLLNLVDSRAKGDEI